MSNRSKCAPVIKDGRTEDNRLFVSIDEAGLLLGISRSSAFKAVADGSIPSRKIGGRIVVPIAGLLVDGVVAS